MAELNDFNFEIIEKYINKNAHDYLVYESSDYNINALNEYLSGQYKGIDFLSFDWVYGSDDRNWWWQIQQLPVFKWYIGSFELLDLAQRNAKLEQLFITFQVWYDNACYNNNSPLVWHDHVAALRLRNIIQFITAIIINGQSDEISCEYKTLLIDVVSLHIDYLNNDENYSKHTNHGFDQALDLYSMCLMWGGIPSLKDVRFKAKSRLLDEIGVAFTEQGVHKENSPGYQGYMYQRLKVVERLKILGESDVSSKVSELAYKVQQFWQAITLPDGKLPLIGDTKIDDKGNSSADKLELSVFDYSLSGYVVARGKVDNKFYQIIFKNCHESNYHRHDDDLSCYIYYNDEVLFGDGGLFSYNENDHVRKFLRSSGAHNVCYPSGIPCIRDNRKLVKKPTTTYRDEIVCGFSYSYENTVLRRDVDLSLLKYGVLKIKDSSRDLRGELLPVVSNFFFQFEGKIYLANNCFYIKTDNNFVKVVSRCESGNVIYKVFSSKDDESLKSSSEFNSLYEASRVIVLSDSSKSLSLEHSICFDIKDGFIDAADSMGLLGLTPDDFAEELWSMSYLRNENKDVNLALYNLLELSKPEQLTTKVLYLHVRELLHRRDYNKVKNLLCFLIKRHDVTPSQLLNSIYRAMLISGVWKRKEVAV